MFLSFSEVVVSGIGGAHEREDAGIEAIKPWRTFSYEPETTWRLTAGESLAPRTTGGRRGLPALFWTVGGAVALLLGVESGRFRFDDMDSGADS